MAVFGLIFVGLCILRTGDVIARALSHKDQSNAG